MSVIKIYRLLFVLFVLVPFGAHAYIDKNIAVIQVMNKAAGKTQTIMAPVGGTVGFEKLNITVRACKQSDPFDAENFYAFTEISRGDGGMIYSNWLDHNNPGKNPVQNADYDIWLLRCE